MLIHTLAPDLTIYEGDVRQTLLSIPDESVQCCLTSPPYWGLRDYQTATWEGGDPNCDHGVKRWEGPKQTQGAQSGHASKADKLNRTECAKCGAKRVDYQLGMEPLHDCQGWATGDPCGECYVCHMVQVFREVRRILRKDGTLWLNLGDSYNGSGGAGGDYGPGGIKEGQPKYGGRRLSTLKPKDLCGIPERVVLALQADGWYWRAKPPWIKGNCMPESVTDRPTTAHENWFLFSKSQAYFFDADAVRIQHQPVSIKRAQPHRTPAGRADREGQVLRPGQNPQTLDLAKALHVGGRNRRTSDWWNESLDETIGNLEHHINVAKAMEGYLEHLKHIRENGGLMLDTEGTPIGLMANTEPNREAHYASYGRKVIENQILCSTSPMACPHCGAPWERVVQLEGQKAGRDRNHGGRTDGRARPAQWENRQNPTTRHQLGWKPTCSCEANDGSGKCTVLDPFNGTGTTMRVARANGRAAIGCELSPEYVGIATKLLLTPVDMMLLETAATQEEGPKQMNLLDQLTGSE